MPTIKHRLMPVPFTTVTFEDTFWAPRIEINRTVTLPAIYQHLEATGRISAFDLEFQRPVPSPMPLVFGDSDPAKWLEAASYALTTHPDPDLAARVDYLADKIIQAQQPDGYLNTHFIVAQPEMRWSNLRDWHEMYCAGHLIEGAVAHYQATGKRKLLDALSRYADQIDATFGPESGKKRGYGGHPEIELALIRLYHATNNVHYLNLASFFVDERGTQPHYYDIEAHERGEDPADFWAKTYEYCQAQLPIRQQEKVVGHAVRAMYLLSGVADLAHEKDDPTLLETCHRLWNNLITRRMYITGAIGPSRHNEGFTLDYDLPDETAYGETCATIGLILWNHRLLQFTGESKYADVIERGLYNAFLSGVSLDGARFFYENPLASDGGHHRQTWFECPCCPPNLARLMASLGGYFYSTGANDVWVHLYAHGSVKLNIAGSQVNLRQVTNYPWNGLVKFELSPVIPQTFTLHLRLPGWCEQWSLRVNGQPVPGLTPGGNGYLAITRQWQAGDTVEFFMEMPVQAMRAHPAVRFLQRRIALQRGPVVYCLEGVDHDNIILDRISIDPQHLPSSEFSVEYQENLLGGVCVIHGKGEVVDEQGWEDTLYRNSPPVSRYIDITAIPYYAWDNRAAGEMRVWIAEKK
jgi:DUF1680 family protein